MKSALLFLLCHMSFQLIANMANPVISGTQSGRPFVNQFVDVVHEDLFIKVDKRFSTAQFHVKYHINSTEDGIKIPFLFYAHEYLGEFTVKVDGKEVSISPIPDEYAVPERTKFDHFSYFFEPPSYSSRSTVTLWQSGSSGRVLNMNDFIYFETDISKGAHVIEVSYKATNWKDTSDWITEYSFRYALSPAKYWKSFGTLTIKLDASQFNQKLTSNLGKPSDGSINTIATWNFNELPTEIAQWSYQRPMKPLVKNMVTIGPNGMAFLTAIILSILHYIWVRKHRKRHPKARFSIAVILGSIVVVTTFAFCSMYYYEVIDDLIGSDAGRSHGYTFGFVLISPVLFLVYLVIFWLIDKDVKQGPKEGEDLIKPAS